MNSALAIIEEVYSIALNPTEDYFAQLLPLAANGELANHNYSLQVLLSLCKIVDAQAKEITALKDDRQAIAKKMIELEEKQHAKTTDRPKLDASVPLQS